ncbi:hypothetical protein DFS33DRAFT_1490415 [Desarmillaria ectypa]|nr:hypothetical protein DFS33DRAFT_1490415 [Desarmillaria ectypa]
MSDLEPGISEAGPIGNAWIILKETTEMRWETLKDYMTSSRELTQCSYSACPHPDEGPKRALRRGEGCCFEYYCSKECRKLDWRDGHNDVCRTIQYGLRDGLSMLMSKHERYFAYAIIEKDIQDNARFIQKLKSEKLRDADGPIFLLNITDYTPVPRQLYVLTDEEFLRTENLPAEKWNTAFGLAKEADKDLVLSIIPQGTKAHVLLDIYPFHQHGPGLSTELYS